MNSSASGSRDIPNIHPLVLRLEKAMTPMAMADRLTAMLSQDMKVRSLAKNTFGSVFCATVSECESTAHSHPWLGFREGQG